MTLSDHYRSTTEKMIVSIVTSDAATLRIEVVGRDAAVIQATPPSGPLVHWPKVGELWMVRRENGVWQLDAAVEDPAAVKSISSLFGGEALIQADTIWMADGDRVAKLSDLGFRVFLLDYWNAGHADYTLAFQAAYAALNAMGGGTLVLPDNRVMDVAAQLNAPSNTTTIGPRSAVVRQKAGVGISIFTASGKTNVHFLDFTIDGQQASQTAGIGFNLVGASDFSIRGVRVRNFYSNGILIDTASSDGLVLGNYISDCGNLISSATSGGHGIALSSGSVGIRIVANRIKNNYSSGVSCSDSYECTITGNSIRATVLNISGYGGIRFSNGSKGNTASGNSIKGTSRGIFAVGGTGVQGNTITGNRVEGTNFQGILVESDFNTIIGNSVKNCCLGTTDGAIRITGTYNSCVGNTVIDDQGSPTHQYGIRESGSYNTVVGNTISGFTGNAVDSLGTGSKVQNNTTSQTIDRPSAATLTLKDHTDYVNVTGTTPITSITASRIGRIVTLRFHTGAANMVVDGGNLKLAGNFSPAAGSTLTLVCDGTDWYEISRSSN